MKFSARALYLSIVVSLTAFSAVFYTSCRPSGNDDSCQAIACAHGGTCAKGSCICPAGYEGNNCEITTRDRFLGGWRVAETGTLTAYREYQVAIESSSEGADHIYLKNLYNYFSRPVAAYVVRDSIFIPNQQLQGKVVFGVGYIDTVGTSPTANQIVLRYEVVDSATQKVDDFGYYEALDGSKPSLWSK